MVWLVIAVEGEQQMKSKIDEPYASLALGFLISIHAGSATADWQERRLLEPTAAERDREQQGEVFIYDGLKAGQVEGALDSQFQRIDNMMFIRTVHPPPEPGMQEEVDDDCG